MQHGELAYTADFPKMTDRRQKQKQKQISAVSVKAQHGSGKADRHYCVVPYGIRRKNAALRLTGSFASWCSNQDSSGKEVTVKAEDAKLYERNINEGDKVCLDVNNKLEKAE